MIKKLAAFGLTAALVLSPVVVFAQAATPVDTTPPAAGAPAAEPAPMMHHMHHKMKKMEKKIDAPAPDAPK